MNQMQAFETKTLFKMYTSLSMLKIGIDGEINIKAQMTENVYNKD